MKTIDEVKKSFEVRKAAPAARYKYTDCPDCKSNGIYNPNCKTCGGSGKVPLAHNQAEKSAPDRLAFLKELLPHSPTPKAQADTESEIDRIKSQVKKAVESVQKSNRPFRCSCGGTINLVPNQGDDSDPDYECDDCGQIFRRDDWRSDRLKPVEKSLSPAQRDDKAKKAYSLIGMSMCGKDVRNVEDGFK